MLHKTTIVIAFELEVCSISFNEPFEVLIDWSEVLITNYHA